MTLFEPKTKEGCIDKALTTVVLILAMPVALIMQLIKKAERK